jgi:hypothetical protein
MAVPAARADTYTLLKGGSVEGRPVSFDAISVIILGPNGEPRVRYDEFTQDSLKLLHKQAPRPEDQDNIYPYITDFAREKVKQREIEIKPVARLDRPAAHTGLFAAFSSSIGLALILLLYAANLFAAYEISVFRNFPPAPVCGLSAIAPFVGPVVFLCLKDAPGIFRVKPSAKITETGSITELAELAEPHPAAPRAQGAVVTEIAPEGSIAPVAPAAPALPEPVIFKRGEFSFNRRFFETKMPGFFRVLPTEKEKDLLLMIKSARGDFSGRRISRIGPNDLDLEIAKGNATASEMIPFTDIFEVQIRHKELPPE